MTGSDETPLPARVKRLDAGARSASPLSVDDDRAKPPKDAKPPADREGRLAKALRANLKRRKAPRPAKTAPESN